MSFTNNPLLGIWSLKAAIARHEDGTIEPEAYGPNPSGYITYTVEGRMMVIFSKRDRPPLSGNIRSPFSPEMQTLPRAELADAFSSFNAYAGTYTLSGDTVIHHVEMASIPNRVGTDLVRTVALNGNQLRLKTPPLMRDGKLQTFELIWERILA